LRRDARESRPPREPMMKDATLPVREPQSVEDEKRNLRRYWDAHPISTDSVPYEAGTRESFEAIYEKWKGTIDAMRLEFLESCRGRRVLEVGCGIGKDARFLTENEIDYTGLDYSFRTLGLARKHFDYVGLRKRFVNGDAVALPFPDGAFGLAMSVGVIHHIVGTTEACRELVRVTAPGAAVADIGCGTKPYRQYFCGAARYFGIDLPAERSANKLEKRADVYADLQWIPIADESFEVVL
jgi:SAM-dependent methyltransferase